MTNRICLVAGVLALACSAHASSRPECGLENPSFEHPDLAAAWTPLNRVSANTDLSTHGSSSIEIDGPEFSSWAISAVWQAFDTSPGQTWSGSVRVASSTAEPLSGAARGIVNIEWRDAADQLISYQTWDVADASSEPGLFSRFDFTSDPAPAGAVRTRFLLGMLQSPANDAGRAVFDQATFAPSTQNADTGQWADFPSDRTVSFAGYTWRVKGPGVYGPGGTRFSPSEDMVSVSEQGLRMQIAPEDGVWSSTEVALVDPLGYGDYRFTIAPDAGGTGKSQPEDWDPDVVLGLFTWEYRDCYGGWDPGNRHNEFDLELSRWGDPDAELGQWVAQPYNFPGNLTRFNPRLDGQEPVTFAFMWLPDRVECRAWVGAAGDEGESEPFALWTYAGPHLPRPERPRVHLNFWQISSPPRSQQEHTALITDFAFTPLCALDPATAQPRSVDDLYEQTQQPEDLNADGRTNDADTDCLEAWLRSE